VGRAAAKLTTDISGNATPTIAILGTRWLIDFVGRIAEPRRAHDAEFKGRFIETFMTPVGDERQHYGLPIAASARAHVLQQGPVPEGAASRAAGDLGD
jgi:multiple sugar transport system substrate-binding protein